MLKYIRTTMTKRRLLMTGCLLAIILFTSLIRFRMLDIPLERDEGEYAYAGQLILQGTAPYQSVYNMKLPGIYAAYAVILAVFGQTQSGIHLGLLIINAATILMVFLLGKKLYDPFTALCAAAAFAVLSLGREVQGFFANAEHFVIFFALAGIILLLTAVKSKKYVTLCASAFLLGLAFLMKQHSILFIAFGGTYLLITELANRPLKLKKLSAALSVFVAGAVLPFALTCLILWRLGVFQQFWFWTFDYALKYISALPAKHAAAMFKISTNLITTSAISIWIAAAVGLTALFWNKKTYPHRWLVLGFLVFSFLAVCPGMYFRPHYFVLMLPAIALLAGLGAASVRDILLQAKSPVLRNALPIIIFAAVLFHACYQQKDLFFKMDPNEASRSIYGRNPFVESLKLADYLKKNTSEDDTIAVIGSEPQIFFYSNRRSATGHIYAYPLVEAHPFAEQMQKDMMAEIEKAKPKFIVYVNVWASWMPAEGSKNIINGLVQNYAMAHYERSGMIDIYRDKPTIYHWGQDCLEHPPKSENWIAIYKRID